MYCRYCGSEIPNDSLFCACCGRGLSNTIQKSELSSKLTPLNTISHEVAVQKSLNTSPQITSINTVSFVTWQSLLILVYILWGISAALMFTNWFSLDTYFFGKQSFSLFDINSAIGELSYSGNLDLSSETKLFSAIITTFCVSAIITIFLSILTHLAKKKATFIFNLLTSFLSLLFSIFWQIAYKSVVSSNSNSAEDFIISELFTINSKPLFICILMSTSIVLTFFARKEYFNYYISDKENIISSNNSLEPQYSQKTYSDYFDTVDFVPTEITVDDYTLISSLFDQFVFHLNHDNFTSISTLFDFNIRRKLLNNNNNNNKYNSPLEYLQNNDAQLKEIKKKQDFAIDCVDCLPDYEISKLSKSLRQEIEAIGIVYTNTDVSFVVVKVDKSWRFIDIIYQR